ncbi:MAG: ribonuclease [Candidatus Binatota bacterium]|nr:ribonuclease [Candidatus Binatota bacterium]
MTVPAAGGGAIRIVPLGGLGEIGLNLLVVEWRPEGADQPEAAVAIDCGVMFPGLETPGIDLVIPDLSYLRSLGSRLLAVLLTHGHEDHIGALPFLLREQNVAIYGTEFTLGLVGAKLEEHGLRASARLSVFRPRERWPVGPFEIEALHVTHSIVDASALAIHTPVGTVVHTGDFKVDHTPIDGRASDLARFAELGAAGVLCLLSDSTNAERPGSTPSEREVAPGLDHVFRRTSGKVVATTFASHIHRVQQIADASRRFGRRIALLGRSLVDNVRLAGELGKLALPADAMVDVDATASLPGRELTVITTGSQGEPRSALARIALGDHPRLSVGPGDAVVISARVIPGNERAVSAVVNHLYRHGADVYADDDADVHVSGHASQEELRLMLRLTRPRFFVPVHGEYRQLVRHARLAVETGVPEESCYVLEDGHTLAIDANGARREEPVGAGRVFVDGKGVGDVEEVVLRDRRHLAEDGLVLAVVGVHSPTGEIVAGPDLVSRGFVFEGARQELLDEARAAVVDALAAISPESRSDPVEVQESVRRTLKRFFSKRLDRRPMIIPYVVAM